MMNFGTLPAHYARPVREAPSRPAHYPSSQFGRTGWVGAQESHPMPSANGSAFLGLS